MSLIITIDRRSRTPVFQQIIDRIIDLIDTRAIRPGARLPSSRSLADRLGINRSTVYRAYQELWSLGYVESRPGSYSIVRKRALVAAPRDEAAPSLIDWPERVSAAFSSLHAAHVSEETLVAGAADPGVINFIPLAPDVRLLPMDVFRKCLNEVLVSDGPGLLGYGDPRGHDSLREYIAERMRLHGVLIGPDQIMMTVGAQNAIELVSRLLLGPGRAVVVEAPTYSRAIDILRLSQAEILEVPMNDRGLDLDVLKNLMARTSPATIYTIPNFHNPTGITSDQDHREQLYDLCVRHRVVLVEDGFEEEMKYFGQAVLPIKSMDRHGVVVYVGTFSKVLFPGLRVGWIAADKACLDRLVPIQRASLLAGDPLVQAALDRFCRAGHYDRHLRRLHHVYRRRMRTALEALQTHLDQTQVQWTRPKGGYTIWLELKGRVENEQKILKRLLDHGVALSPGSLYFHGSPGGVFFRLSIAGVDEPAIEEGIKRLGRSLEKL